MCVCLRMAASPGALEHDPLGALLLRLYSNHPNGAAGLLRCLSLLQTIPMYREDGYKR